jgi:uncharacterized protein YkwD
VVVAGGAALLGLTSSSTLDRKALVPAVVNGCEDVALRPSEKNADRVAAATLCLLNAERSRRDLPPLRPERDLAKAARRHAADMAEHDYFAHESPEGSEPADRIFAAGYTRQATVGENLAWGEEHEGTPARIVDGWMHSEGHKANILRPNFREIGIGLAYDAPRASSARSAAVYVTTFGSASSHR